MFSGLTCFCFCYIVVCNIVVVIFVCGGSAGENQLERQRAREQERDRASERKRGREGGDRNYKRKKSRDWWRQRDGSVYRVRLGRETRGTLVYLMSLCLPEMYVIIGSVSSLDRSVFVNTHTTHIHISLKFFLKFLRF